MATDYDKVGFAARFARARPLDQARASLWEALLAEAVSAREVRIVLDVGAGTGRFWPVISAAWKPTLLVAVDRSREMLRYGGAARGVGRGIADLENLPIRRSSVDLCFCSMCIHHSTNPSHAVQGISAVLRAGGYFVLRTGTAETIDSVEFLRYFPTASAAEARSMPREAHILEWLAGAGLEVVRISVVHVPPASRFNAFESVLRRGFPSLQLVGRGEFVLGSMRFALHLLRTWIYGSKRPSELVMLYIAQRGDV